MSTFDRRSKVRISERNAKYFTRNSFFATELQQNSHTFATSINNITNVWHTNIITSIVMDTAKSIITNIIMNITTSIIMSIIMSMSMSTDCTANCGR